jgi:hypothetical protein
MGITSLAELATHPRSGASWEGFALEQVLRIAQLDQAYFWASRTVLLSRKCIRRTLPIVAMVITPMLPRCTKRQQGRSNTRVKFRSAQASEVGQISVGANMRGALASRAHQPGPSPRACCAGDHALGRELGRRSTRHGDR